MAMTLHATAEHGAFEDVEGGKQRRGAVPLVVMGQGSGLARLQRQAWLGAVEGLDLAFLVDRQHDGVGRRTHVEADDVGDLFAESRIIGALEGADAVGLEVMGLPDALHGAQRDADCLGDGTAGRQSEAA